MTRSNVTSYDIAQAAGVSQSAVSRAFTPGSPIAEETRRRILEVAAELGYQPNALARGMSTARRGAGPRSGMAGLIVTRLQDPFFATLVQLFSHALQRRGLHVLLFNVETEGEVGGALGRLMEYRIDGAIILSALLGGRIAEACHNIGLPVVLFNRAPADPAIGSVRIRNEEGGRVAGELLCETGHQRIAFLAGADDDDTSEMRERGLCAGLVACGRELMRREAGDYTFESGYEAGRRLLARAERPDAVFCASDVMALGVMQAARRDHGLCIPADLSVMGFDDIPQATWPDHALTTIRQPVARMVRAAVTNLLARIEDPEAAPSRMEFDGELIIRRSVQLAPSARAG